VHTPVTAAPKDPAAGPGSKLLGSAVAMLSRRECSRAELRRRLLRRAQPAVTEAEVDRVLDLVQAQGLLSEERFIEEFIRARTARFGPVRLRHELLRRGVDKDRIHAALSAHQGNELATAQALWQKRFKLPATDPRERARQARFLAARGFSHEVIRRVLDSA
jgi:regulatory protein